MRFGVAALLAILCACSSTTDKGAVDADRRQLMLVSSSQITHASAQAYEQTKAEAQKKAALDRNPALVSRVQGIMRRLVPHVSVFRRDAVGWAWEAHVISSDELNAYCMPGGKIMFYTGIIEKLNMTDGEIAAVMGHEMAHALREHGRERMSEALLQQTGVGILVATGVVDQKYAGALGALSSIAIALPHSRNQESEADDMGVELMARAGFDPTEAANLWRKMARQGGKKPPQILSSHPADETRIRRIESLIPKVLPLYQATQR
jgi:predicted Zn-dependent protease